MTSTGTGDELSFARDIRPLFREKDRDSMMRAFDLPFRDPEAGPSGTSGKVLHGAWPASQVDKLQQWIDHGKPA